MYLLKWNYFQKAIDLSEISLKKEKKICFTHRSSEIKRQLWCCSAGSERKRVSVCSKEDQAGWGAQDCISQCQHNPAWGVWHGFVSPPSFFALLALYSLLSILFGKKKTMRTVLLDNVFSVPGWQWPLCCCCVCMWEAQVMRMRTVRGSSHSSASGHILSSQSSSFVFVLLYFTHTHPPKEAASATGTQQDAVKHSTLERNQMA